MSSLQTIPRAELEAAWELVARYARPTTFIRSERLDDLLGCQVTLVSETFQRTGSFKFRAAINFARHATAAEVVSASSGNFGQAIALATRLFGMYCTVVMPTTAAQVKVHAVVGEGASVELVDTQRTTRAARVAELLAGRSDRVYAPAYDHPLVVAGNSSLGREIFACGESFDAVFVPVGGGGLISGIIAARDALGNATPIVGAEPLIANDAAESLRQGRIVANEREPQTIADGARTLSLGEVTFPIVQHGVEGIVEVPEAGIEDAVRALFSYANLKAEPTGALSLGALQQVAQRWRRKHVACVISGGNVDPAVYARILLGQ